MGGHQKNGLALLLLQTIRATIACHAVVSMHFALEIKPIHVPTLSPQGTFSLFLQPLIIIFLNIK